uniref:hypothetical protein n=1 Tax=Pararhizobium sp. IMCC3301 TaxID=3067904 RepID=UPI0027407A27|nr:hypothetical protein [Pararhizobium sp. IMCC3301]
MEIGKFRFWIGSETERLSSVWVIWDHAGQVYMTSKGVGGAIKLSVHAAIKGNPSSDFVCQFGLTAEYRMGQDAVRVGTTQPNVLRWKRKQATEGDAHVLARLLFPTNYLLNAQAAPKNRRKKFQAFFESAPAGSCVLIQLIALPKPEVDGEYWKANEPARTIIHMPLGRAEQCVVVGQNVEFDPGLPIGKQISLPQDHLHPRLQSFEPEEVTRELGAIFHSSPEDYECIDITDTSGLPMTMNLRKGAGDETTIQSNDQ